MAFNKTKILENAQKFLSQGKLPQAIAEYQQILRHEPEDQVTLMTIGDLYVRSGDTSQALAYFEKLAQLFVNDGFISKSIAIYKKIVKLAPEEVGAMEKLAELYVQQGVMSEARPIYLQLAETHLKSNRTPQAIEVLRKLLELAPDNLRVQARLAELYQSIGQPAEAAHAFLNSAHRMLDKGDFVEAQKMAERAMHLDPKNTHAISLKARCLAASGKVKDAIGLLERMPDVTAGADTTELLIELFLQTNESKRAVELARKAFSRGPEHYPVVYSVATALLDAGEAEPAMDLVGEIRGAALEAGDTERLSQTLNGLIERMPTRIEPREWLVDIYRRTSDAFRLPDALDQLGEAAVAAGKLDRAKEVFQELLERAPEDENNKRRLKQVCARLGVPMPELEAEVTVAESTEHPPDLFEELTAVPTVEAAPTEGVDEETQKFLTQALTDVDLFSSYGLTQKGIDLLENVLRRVPGYVPALEKLLDLNLGSGNEKRTAEIAAQLEAIYTKKGDTGNADKFAQLRRRFARAAERTEAAAPAAEFAVTAGGAAPPAEEPVIEVVGEDESAVHEVDLSEEWAALSEQTPQPQAAAPAPPAEAPPAPAPPPKPAEPEFEETTLEAEIVRPEPPPAPVEPPPPPAPEAAAAPPEPAAPAEGATYELPLEEPAKAPPPPPPPPPPAAPAEPMMPEPAVPEPEAVPSPTAAVEFAEMSDELEEAEKEPEPAAPTYEISEPEAAPVEAAGPAAMTADQFLSSLGEEMGDLIPPSGADAPPAPSGKAGAAAASRGTSDHLREVFDEFRAEMGEMADEEAEDLETHYNLGIAYREMGLLEEAIGEFQKVAKTIQRGRPFKYSMQCYTLLGLSFMEKSQPKIAAIWYEQALKTPGLDPESILAVRYDLGVAQDQAGDTKAALDSFSQVYAMNIDYRDVAERIAALSKR